MKRYFHILNFSLRHFAIIAMLATPSFVFAIDWSWSLNNGGGTFTSSEADSSTSLSGTFTRLANGFVEMTTTSGSGAQYPGNGTIFYPVEVPGFFLAVPPLLSSETQMAYNITAGSCPGKSVKYNWTFQGWTGTNDLTSTNQGVFGEFTWNDVTQSATIDSIFNVANYGNPSWYSGAVGLTVASCGSGTAAVTYETPGTDRSGQLYLSQEGGLIYKTDSNRLIFGVPQVKIPDQSIFYDTYTSYITRYDTSGTISENFKPARISIVSSGASASGSVLSDIKNNTTDGTYGGVSITIDSINDPADGMFRGTLTRNANNAKVICMAHFTTKTILFCASQTEGDTTKPSNLILVSDDGKSGRLDHTFGSGGIQIADYNGIDSYDGLWAITTDSISGKIVAAGHSNNGNPSYDDALVIRLNSDGSLDTSFASGGILEFDLGGSDGTYDGVKAVSVQSDGKIVGAGSSNGITYNTYSTSEGGNLTVFRTLTDGTLDSTFGTTGIVTLPNSFKGSNGNGIAIGSDGKIIVTGSYGVAGPSLDSLVARFNSDGTLDSSFATGGLLVEEFGDGYGEILYSVLIDSNNKIIAGGWGYEVDTDIITLIRLNTDGSMDTTFGTGGRVKTRGDAWSGQWWNDFRKCIEDSTLKIVCVGFSSNGTTGYDATLARYLTNGNLDTSFNSTGTAVYAITSNDDAAYSVLEVKGNKYVIGGESNSYLQTFVARINSDGSLDTTFGSDGTGIHQRQIGSDENFILDMTLDAKGRIVAAGSVGDSGNSNNGFLYRYWP